MGRNQLPYIPPILMKQVEHKVQFSFLKKQLAGKYVWIEQKMCLLQQACESMCNAAVMQTFFFVYNIQIHSDFY